jgi:hypothetical protein
MDATDHVVVAPAIVVKAPPLMRHSTFETATLSEAVPLSVVSGVVPVRYEWVFEGVVIVTVGGVAS